MSDGLLEDPADNPAREIPLDARRRSTLRKMAWGMVLGCGLGAALLIGIAMWLNRGQPPMLKPGELDAAEARWRQHESADYDLDLDASLGLAGKMHVEVRKGKVVATTLNGEPTRPHLWDYWSVSGLFEVMRLDQERNRAAEHDPAGAQLGPVLQQARFDPESGLPLEYRRSEQNAAQAGGWRITHFQAVR